MDRRRFAGPETSRPVKRKIKISPDGASDGKRSAGRAANEIRPLCKSSLHIPPKYKIRKVTLSRTTVLKTGLVTSASGSAYVETGNLKVVCSVCVRSTSFSYPSSLKALYYLDTVRIQRGRMHLFHQEPT